MLYSSYIVMEKSGRIKKLEWRAKQMVELQVKGDSIVIKDRKD